MSQLGVQLRPLTAEDLPKLKEWLEAPHVTRHWGSYAQRFEAAKHGVEQPSDGDRHDLVTLDGAPVGYVRRYRLHDFPKRLARLTDAGVKVPEDAWSFDYLIGDTTATGRGLGRRMLMQAVERTERDDPNAECILIPVHQDNLASWKAMQGAGFANLPGLYELPPLVETQSRDHVVLRHNFR